ncbi:MAG: hypothetical protein GX624_03095 [Actinobacteria bacterium]|nr:hypothetical protein [Actinomycetota bacterium]
MRPHRLRRSSPVALVLVGVISLCSVFGLSACAAARELWAGAASSSE